MGYQWSKLKIVYSIYGLNIVKNSPEQVESK